MSGCIPDGAVGQALARIAELEAEYKSLDEDRLRIMAERSNLETKIAALPTEAEVCEVLKGLTLEGASGCDLVYTDEALDEIHTLFTKRAGGKPVLEGRNRKEFPADMDYPDPTPDQREFEKGTLAKRSIGTPEEQQNAD